MSSVAVSKPKPVVHEALPVPSRIYFYTDYGTVDMPSSAFSQAGFRAWAVSDDFPERGRISYLDGELFIDMSPEELYAHGQVKLKVTSALDRLVDKLDSGELFPDRTLLTNEAAGLSTEPDACFGTWETLESGRLQQVPLVDDEERVKELQGTPDWVLEIISDSSVNKDRRRLWQLYHRAGIPEYWLIDARGEEIEFRILLLTSAGYEEAEVKRGGWQVSRVFRRQFRLLRTRNRANHWKYVLQVKPVR
jgi:Uma2 family endonuclease